MRENRILVGILIIFSILLCLSAVSAQDLSDEDLAIQESSGLDLSIQESSGLDLAIQESSELDLSSQDISVSESAVDNDENYQSEIVDNLDNDNQVYQENLQENDCDDEIIKSSSSNNPDSISVQSDSESDVLGDDPNNEDPVIVIVDIDPNPQIIEVFVALGATLSVDGNTFADIQNTISRAKNGDCIVLNPGTRYLGNGTPIIVNKHLSFKVFGQNAILDGQNTTRIMEVGRECQVSIDNVDFINGNAHGDKDSAGAIVWGGPNGYLKNCNFVNNRADNYAGAVLWGSNDATIENCNFINNSAPRCGAFLNYAYRNKIINSNFYNNSAGEQGGAIYIFFDGTQIANCNFENNSASYGAAIRTTGVGNTITNCNFVNNPASYGGAIYWKGTDGSISDSRFRDNSARYGGAILFIEGNCSISNCNFINNSATTHFGGAICSMVNNAKITNSNFTHNFANGEKGMGGAISILAMENTVSNCIFINNSATLYGGAIFSAGVETDIDGQTLNVSKGLIIGSSFVDNFAEKGDAILFANVVYDYKYSTTMTDCSFKYKANSSSLNPNDENLCLTFTLESSLDYSDAFSGVSNRSNIHLWKGGPFYDINYAIDLGTIKGVGQNIILEIYDSKNHLIANTSNTTDSSGRITYDYRSLADGQYTYRAYHPDNDDFSFIQKEGSFERSHIPTNLSISVTDVTYPGTAVATITASSPGTYKLTVAGTPYDDLVFTESEIANGNGRATKTVNVDLLGANDAHTASITYERTDLYETASNQTTFKVFKAGSLLDVNGSTIYYGSDAELAYLVENGSLSLVSIKKGTNALQNGVDFNTVIDNNKVTISGLAEGVYTLAFTTVVDNNHTAATKEVTVTVNPLVDLSIVGTINNQTPYFGGDVEYTLTVTNNGPSLATEVIVSGTVPEGMNVSSPDASYIGNGVWNISSIGVSSENAIALTLYATINSVETLTNTFNVASKEDEKSYFDNAIDLAVQPVPIADIAVGHDLTYLGGALKVGDDLTCTIQVLNLGPCDASNIRVIYDFDSTLLSLINVNFDDAISAVDGIYTIDSIANGSFTKIILTFKVIANGTIENNVRVESATLDYNESNNAVQSASIYAIPLADLSIEQSVNTQTPYYGDTIAYTITVTNNGPSTATNLIVSDTVPEGMNVSSPDASYIGNGIWNIASIGVGSENAVTLTLYATVNALESINNTVSVVCDEDESDFTNNLVSLEVNVLPVNDLMISMDSNVSKAYIGDLFTYTITVTNNGPCDATGVSVKGVFSSLLGFVSALAGVGNYDFSTNVWEIGNLDSLASANLTLNVKVLKHGTISNSFKVEASEYDSDPSNNIADSLDIQTIKNSTKVIAKNMVTTAIDTAVDGKKGQYFSLTLKDANNNPLKGKNIKIILNKVTYNLKTDLNGVAKLQVNLKNAGTYSASIKFAGDDYYYPSSSSIKIKVKKQKPKLTASKKTFKAKAKVKKISVKLKTSRGKALKSKKLVLTIKGKKYKVKTNKKGVATAKIKLTKKGKYTCKIRFAGDKTYSAINKKIKVVLK